MGATEGAVYVAMAGTHQVCVAAQSLGSGLGCSRPTALVGLTSSTDVFQAERITGCVEEWGKAVMRCGGPTCVYHWVLVFCGVVCGVG